MKLQKFGFDESSYERPNRKWTCGRSCDGCPCKEGPKEKPVLNIFTASCSQKENKCKPMRTVRGQRYVLSFSIIVFSLLIVFYILFNQEKNKSFVSPGPLSSHHSTIQGQNCLTCHDLNGHKSWVGASLSDHSSLADSKKCLECHKFNSVEGHDELDLAALNPHSIQNAAVFVGKEAEFKKELACTTCHHEHQGYDNDMKHMSDKRCQSCHEKSFNGLDEHHPEFVLYPYKKENYVNFSHQTHVKYFDENNRADLLGNENCVKCHTQNPDEGNIIKMTTYSQVCSTCHNHKVPINDVAVNILSLSNPLSDKAVTSISSESTFEGGKVKDLNETAIIRYFNDKQSLLNVVEGKTSSSLSFLTFTDEETIKKMAAELAVSWDDLLYVKEAMSKGESLFKALQWALVARAYKVDSGLTKNSLKKNKAKLISLFVEDKEIAKYLKMAMKAFGLKCNNAVEFAESLKHERIEKFIEEAVVMLPDDIKKAVPYNLTLEDKDSFVIKYLESKGKLNQKTVDKLNSLIKTNPSTIYKYVKELDIPTGTSVYYSKFYKSLEDLVEDKPGLLKKVKDNYSEILTVFVSDFYKDKDVLKNIAKVVDRKISKKFKSSSKASEVIGLLKEYEPMIKLNFAFILDEKSTTGGVSEPQLPKIPEVLEFSKAEADNWGIKKDAANNTILIHNTKPFHASPLMVKAYSKEVFELSVDPAKSQGKCMQCHSRISRDKINNWKTPSTKKSLTKFSHVPHGDDCSSCHKFKTADDSSLASFPNYHKDFSPMQKMDCAKCHNENGASDGCLKCHNYHSTDYSSQKGGFMDLIKFFEKE